ncbi:MAG: ORF2 [Bat faecal associated dicistrovirus 1]|nr:MAG: ORF2 [Bat faecal associated dicistrovirus 1]
MSLKESYLEMTITKDKMHTINTFLERPVRVWSGFFSTHDLQATAIYNQNYPEVLIANEMYKEKLAGFVGLRADVEITVQINAQKFQQGRLRLQYYPYAQYLPYKNNLVNSSLTGITSAPGIDIDVCGGSNPQSRIAEATFRIPYVSPHTYFNLITGDGTLGSIALFVYSPLISSNSESSNCEVTIWARFINPKLAFPTSAPMKVMQAQVKGEAKKIAQTGVISNTLGKLAETLNTASKIPVIGQYMAIPEWISRSGESLCKLFGWSKPTMPMDTKLRTNNCMSNFNGKDSSHKLALSAENEIDTPGGLSGTNLDEMAISSICKVPAYYQSFNWTTVSGSETILWYDPINPLKYTSIPSTNAYAVTPVGFVANCFGLWRGSLVYTFKLVKTGFHAGRLRIFYVPYGNKPEIGAPMSTQIEKNYQVVVDIEESNTFSFKVPFVATKPWFNVRDLGSATENTNINTGYIVVTVLNQLRAVSTVSPIVSVLVEVSGGDDLTFACPGAPTFVPGSPVVSALQHEAQVAGTAIEVPRAEAQLLCDPNSISEIDPTVNWSPEAHCIGEKIASIRQLVKRSNYIGTIDELRTGYKNAVASDNVNTFGILNPYGISYTYNKTMDYISYFSYIYAFFRGGVRIKIATIEQSAEGPLANNAGTLFMAKPTSTKNILVRMFNVFNPLYTTIVTKTKKYSNMIGKIGCNAIFSGPYHQLIADACSTTIVANQIEGITEFEVPYYNSTHITPLVAYGNDTTQFPVTSNNASEGAYPLPIVAFGSLPFNTNVSLQQSASTQVEITLDAANYTQYHIYRQAADDYGFHYFVGIPTMIQLPSTSVDIFTPSIS